MRSALILVTLATLAGAAAVPATALAAADPLAALRAGCRTERSADRPPARAVSYRVCRGTIASFDGTKLDATLTLPARPPRGRLPLMVFLHGFLNSQKEIASATREGTGPDRGGEAYKTVRWNPIWFAAKGYAVLTYTARGHSGSEGSIQLASKDFEVRDTRTLTGYLADEIAARRPLVRMDPRRVAVAGGSYGGGQAWMLMTTRSDPRLAYGAWRSPRGRLVRLAAIVPQFTWTDLLYSLAPNGHHLSGGVDPRTALTPIGVGKQTIVNGFLATIGSKLTPQIAQWLARFDLGEPYEVPGDKLVPEIKRALSQDRSAFYQDGYFAAIRARSQRPVPVLAGQGWSDPIFPAIEALRMYRRLRDADPRYPIQLYFGDFEHLSAQAKVADLRHLHGLGNTLLDHYMLGRRRNLRFTAQSAPTLCDHAAFGPVVQGLTYDRLATARRTLDFPGARTLTSPVADQRGSDADPVLGSTAHGRGCLTTTKPAGLGVAVYETPVTRAFTLLGLPRLHVEYRTVANDVEIDSRLWDRAPDGTLTLVTRGAYRAVGQGGRAAVAETELFGNHWRFAAGHGLVLEVLQADAPFLRVDNFPSSVSVSRVRLTLPVRP